jgi:hypothetical protein
VDTEHGLPAGVDLFEGVLQRRSGNGGHNSCVADKANNTHWAVVSQSGPSQDLTFFQGTLWARMSKRRSRPPTAAIAAKKLPASQTAVHHIADLQDKQAEDY